MYLPRLHMVRGYQNLPVKAVCEDQIGAGNLSMNDLLRAVIELQNRQTGCENAVLSGPNQTAYGCMGKPLADRCGMCLAESARLLVIEQE